MILGRPRRDLRQRISNMLFHRRTKLLERRKKMVVPRLLRRDASSASTTHPSVGHKEYDPDKRTAPTAYSYTTRKNRTPHESASTCCDPRTARSPTPSRSSSPHKSPRSDGHANRRPSASAAKMPAAIPADAAPIPYTSPPSLPHSAPRRPPPAQQRTATTQANYRNSHVSHRSPPIVADPVIVVDSIPTPHLPSDTSHCSVPRMPSCGQASGQVRPNSNSEHVSIHAH